MRRPSPLLFVAALLPLLLSGCTSFWTGAEDTPAPTFEITDTDGNPQNLTVHAGRFLLLDFMGTWCGPCQRGVGDLRALQDQYPDLDILSISSTDTADQLRDFRSQYGVTWPMAVDTDRVVPQFADAMNSASWLWPSYALIDPTGQVVFWNRGETLPATLATALEDATGTQAPIGRSIVGPATFALLLGLTLPLSPFLIRHTISDHTGTRARLRVAAIATTLLFAALAWILSSGGRPLTGRVLNVAGIAAIAGLISIAWWRNKGTDAVQGKGNLLGSHVAWKTGLGTTLRMIYVGAPVVLAALLAAFRRTVPAEGLALILALGTGAVTATAVLSRTQTQSWIQKAGDAAALPAIAGTIAAALWIGWMWLV